MPRLSVLTGLSVLFSAAAVAAVMAFGTRAEPPAFAAVPQASTATIRYVPDDLRDDSWLQALKAAQMPRRSQASPPSTTSSSPIA